MHHYAQVNHTICYDAEEAIKCGNYQQLGKSMSLGQRIFDECSIDNCPSELTSPRLHEIMHHPKLK